MKLGIVGLPNVGKSTLFNALTSTQNAQAANYPFCTIEPNSGIVPVPDVRLDKLAEIWQTDKKTPAIVEFVDIAGLVKGASQGAGLGNKFLENIRRTDAIVHVVRCFDDENIMHVVADAGTNVPVDPLGDIETIDMELILADLEMVNRRVEKAAKAAKLVIDNSGCSLNTAAGKKGAYRDLFYSETPLTQEVILAVCANEKSGIFGEQNWWFNARSYGLCWSLVRSFVHTYLKQDGTPFTAAADYAVKSFAEEMEGRDLRLEQTVRGRNFLWDGKTAVADIKNLSLTGYQVIKYTLDESKYDGGAKNINSIPLIRYAEVLLNYAEAQAELGVLTDSEWALTVGALRKRAGITGGTETLPTTVDSYLQRTFYPDVTSPVLLEIRRERAIELVAEGMRFDDLRRWKCGSLMETLRWSGIHIPGLEQPVDVNGDGVNDYYFTEGEVVSAPAAYKNIAVRVNQDGVGLYAEANPVSGYDLVYKTGAGDRYWYPDGRQYLYPIPAKVIRDYRNAGYTISQNPEWDNE